MLGCKDEIATTSRNPYLIENVERSTTTKMTYAVEYLVSVAFAVKHCQYINIQQDRKVVVQIFQG